MTGLIDLRNTERFHLKKISLHDSKCIHNFYAYSILL